MKMQKLCRRTLLIAGGLFLLTQQALSAASDFIEDMPELSKDPDRQGAMIWEKPGLDRAQYTRVMIEPVTLYISPDSKEKGLKADELKALSDEFEQAIVNTLEPEIPVVSQPGPGVAYIRAAIVDIKLEKKKRGLLGYTPVGFVVTAAADAAGMRISLKDAVLETEVLDSVSGERIGVLVDEAPELKDPEGGDDAKEKLSWDAISAAFSYYAERFKSRMQAAM